MSLPFEESVKVSVITPFFKVAPFIERCAESLLHQTLEDVEFIFVDDASPDESHSIVNDKNKYLNFFKLNIKLPFLLSGDKNQYQLWKEWFPESDKYVLENKHLPFRTRLVQWFAAKRLFPLVGLYDFLINKVYYGLRFST